MTWQDDVTRLPHDSRTWWGMGLCCGSIWSRNHHWKLMKTPIPATTAQWLTPTSFIAIIISTIIIGIKKLLEPLKEFKIILKSAFNQFIYGNNLQWRNLWLLQIFSQISTKWCPTSDCNTYFMCWESLPTLLCPSVYWISILLELSATVIHCFISKFLQILEIFSNIFLSK